jgi:hypothetical protein
MVRASKDCRMSSLNSRRAGPPKRMVVRIAIAVAFVMAVALYAAHVEGQKSARAAAASHALSLVTKAPAKALAEAVAAREDYGAAPDIARATWAALMAGGGQHGTAAMRKWTFAYTPRDPGFRLMFSKDSRFLAALDGTTIRVWNTEDGSEVLTTTAGDRFIGYWRIGAQHFGLFASYQYYDLVNSVIELPDGFRYAQASKDSLTAVAPGGDWAYRVPDLAQGRLDYPIKLVNLHTGEKREVDAGFMGAGAVAVNADATRIAVAPAESNAGRIMLWNARSRERIALIASGRFNRQLTFSRALNMLIAAGGGDTIAFVDAESGQPAFDLRHPARAIADDPNGLWFAVASGGTIKLYRGMNNAVIGAIAGREVRRAPATSH